ncbi:thiolase family protein [Cryptosporangium aurantiacum]|uniref:Probable acetyl-CoA acetyltransferase n=1 Tax=Cryptosporangium aurantiacum TaxID=134849 RepID=A0A1M7R4Q7_9ACTN|nr:thiolase family protein [Cryptosporangium aurantiacum]SHN40013.1 acetyl-CoA C-acetyltransferase [Cryptosporangium aurantiacum]
MPEAFIVSAVRTPIGTARKGTLADTSALDLAQLVVEEAARRSGLSADRFDDLILAESGWGGGDIARHAAVAAGMTQVPGQAVNRHCAGSLTSVGNAAATIRAGMDAAVIAGGVHSSSTAPVLRRRVPGTVDQFEDHWSSPSHPDRPDAPNRDMSICVGWNTAVEAGLTREQQDAWALRSHQRAIAALDSGVFADEIVPVKAPQKDGSLIDFVADEHPRRTTTPEKLAALPVLHPEIDGFSITAGNASGVNDAAAALALVSDELAYREGLTPLATVRAWAAHGVDPARTGMAAVEIIPKLLARAGLAQEDVTLWEINEAFASVPVAACKLLGLDEDKVNPFGSGCSLGHPIAASGARMLTTLTHALRRRGGGIGVATMCAGGGQAGGVLIEV